MNNSGIRVIPALAAGFLFSLTTVAVTLAIGSTQIQKQVGEQVEEALQSKLPEAIALATSKVEAEKSALQVQVNLTGWEAAPDQVPDGRHIYGSLNAEFTLVEYSDLECTFCQRFHSTPKGLVDQAGGRINWEWMHYPLGFHNPVASKGSHAALCVSELAGNRAFWAFTDGWFKTSGMGGKGVSDIEALAAGVGAQAEDFNACMASEKFKPVIEQQVAKGTEMGVTGTPGTFVVDNTTGNRLFVRGAQPATALIQAIKQLRDSRTPTEG
jgi:protein-disulfide isomerase